MQSPGSPEVRKRGPNNNWFLREDNRDIRDKNCNYSCRIFKYQYTLFAGQSTKVDGIYYFYFQIIGNIEEANEFKVELSIGHGKQSGIFHSGRVFPIDTKREDIIKEESGVLSFWPGGMVNKRAMALKTCGSLEQ